MFAFRGKLQYSGDKPKPGGLDSRDTIGEQISVFGLILNQNFGRNKKKLDDIETETKMHAETKISAKTDTETEIFRSLVVSLDTVN
jgi:hypothetical protein